MIAEFHHENLNCYSFTSPLLNWYSSIKQGGLGNELLHVALLRANTVALV